MPFTRVNPGDLIQAQNLNQVIGSLNGTSGQGVPIAQVSVNDATNYALSVQNLEGTNSRAINIVKSDGSLLIRADATGVSLGSPLNLAAGSIGTAPIANGAVTNAKLGTDTARLNLLTNGGFEIWQRGNGPFSANAGYSADRWVLSIGSGSALTVNRAAGNNSPYAASVSYTHSSTTQLIQKIEGVGQLVGKTVTFAADIQANTANAMRVLVWDGVGSLNYSAYHTGNGAWQRLVSTITVASSATSLQVYIEFGANVGGGIDNAMLVVGSVAADYAPLHPADDLARCLRYYERQSPELTSVATGASQNLLVAQPFRVPKPVTPTLTVGGSWTATNCSATPSVGQRGGAADSFYYLVSSTASGPAGIYPSGSPAGFISIEANP